MNIQDEEKYVLSAREFVDWYNGLPGPDVEPRHEKISSHLAKSRSVSIVGQGNVAIDVARILLSPIDALRNTDITEQALAALNTSQIERVYVVGRRGPLQAAFTIKELREMLRLPNVNTCWRSKDFIGIDESIIANLPRPKKRITELMLNSVKANTAIDASTKCFLPLFFRSPDAIDEGGQFRLLVNELTPSETAVSTGQTELVQADMVLRSIGYKSVNVVNQSDGLNFDDRRGLIPNIRGRVLKSGSQATTPPPDDGHDAIGFDAYYERGLYASGWLASGPLGVLLTTMNNSFLVASTVCKDFEKAQVRDATMPKSGLDFRKFADVISWDGWRKIDQVECEMGKKVGKPREKILDLSKMIDIGS